MNTLSTSSWLGRSVPARRGNNLFPLILSILLTPLLHAAPEADPSAKLREQLKSTLLQLRKIQTDMANAQAAQAAAEAKNKDLEAQIAKITKQNEELIKKSNSEKTKADQDIAKLNERLAEKDKRLVQYDEALNKWKDGYQKAAAIARTKEDERAALASEVVSLKNTVADRERKNIALFNTCNEILDRFEKYALGKALSAREPFISTTRVKVENLVQGYQDKMVENRIAAPAKKP
jgi:DNA repair exonuclease SbcCD ATPase subunit